MKYDKKKHNWMCEMKMKQFILYNNLLSIFGTFELILIINSIILHNRPEILIYEC